MKTHKSVKVTTGLVQHFLLDEDNSDRICVELLCECHGKRLDYSMSFLEASRLLTRLQKCLDEVVTSPLGEPAIEYHKAIG